MEEGERRHFYKQFFKNLFEARSPCYCMKMIKIFILRLQVYEELRKKQRQVKNYFSSFKVCQNESSVSPSLLID